MPEAIVFLPLTQGKVAVIDFDDFETVRGLKYYAARMGNRFCACRVGPNQATWFLHWDVMGRAGGDIDHRNGDSLDNRRSNLRFVSQRENSSGFRRKAASATSRFRGVSRHTARYGRWKVEIKIEGRRTYVGVFASEEDAARAYDKAARAAGFVREALNFPDES